MIENMTLYELLERKARDYGYHSITQMAHEMGLAQERLHGPACGRANMGMKAKRCITQQLDVSAEVLERILRNDRF